MIRRIDEAKESARRYAAEHFPQASVVLLSGSWARGDAHADSDLDIVVIDETVERVLFDGVYFGNWVVDVCALNPHHAEAFFAESAQYRSAPIARQVVESLFVSGQSSIAEQVRKLAVDALGRGPEPMTESERSEMVYELTLLRQDLVHAAAEALPAIAAYAHVQLSRAVLDARRCWRAERKALRRAVAEADPHFASYLDDALIQAMQGNPTQMVEASNRMLSMLGGPHRTYERFSA